MAIEEQLLGKKLSGHDSIILRIALCVFIMLGLITSAEPCTTPRTSISRV